MAPKYLSVTDRIVVASDNYLYSDTFEHYAADGGPSFSPLPNKITERLYEPGIRHALIANNNVVDGGPMPWPEGDSVIASIAMLVTSKQEREAREAEAMASRRLA